MKDEADEEEGGKWVEGTVSGSETQPMHKTGREGGSQEAVRVKGEEEEGGRVRGSGRFTTIFNRNKVMFWPKTSYRFFVCHILEYGQMETPRFELCKRYMLTRSTFEIHE